MCKSLLAYRVRSPILFTSLLGGGGGVCLSHCQVFSTVAKSDLNIHCHCKKTWTITMNALIRYWNKFLDCTDVELSCSMAGWKKTQVYEQRISTVLLYLFYIRKVLLEGTSNGFFTVWGELTSAPEPVFVDLLRSLGIDSSQAGRYNNPFCRTCPPSYIGWWNRFIGIDSRAP